MKLATDFSEFAVIEKVRALSVDVSTYLPGCKCALSHPTTRYGHEKFSAHAQHPCLLQKAPRATDSPAASSPSNDIAASIRARILQRQRTLQENQSVRYAYEVVFYLTSWPGYTYCLGLLANHPLTAMFLCAFVSRLFPA